LKQRHFCFFPPQQAGEKEEVSTILRHDQKSACFKGVNYSKNLLKQRHFCFFPPAFGGGKRQWFHYNK
jgi:hypothetical protein